jgi:hypothetical protein
MSHIELREIRVLEPDFAVFVCLDENGFAGLHRNHSRRQRMCLN